MYARQLRITLTPWSLSRISSLRKSAQYWVIARSECMDSHFRCLDHSVCTITRGVSIRLFVLSILLSRSICLYSQCSCLAQIECPITRHGSFGPCPLCLLGSIPSLELSVVRSPLYQRTLIVSASLCNLAPYKGVSRSRILHHQPNLSRSCRKISLRVRLASEVCIITIPGSLVRYGLSTQTYSI